MLYQNIDGRKLYSTGAMWFKLPKNPTPEMVNLRRQQVLFYGVGNPVLLEALSILAEEGRYKNYDKAIVEMVEQVVDRMKCDGVTILRHG